MTSLPRLCPGCGRPMESFPSFSENPRLTWFRCERCRSMVLEVDEDAPHPEGTWGRVEYDFERLREIAEKRKRERGR